MPRSHRIIAVSIVTCLAGSVALNANGQDKVKHPRAGAPGEWRLNSMRNLLQLVSAPRLSTVVLALLILGTSVPISAQRAAWELLGTKEIEGRVDHDKINCHGKETYRALQFRVSGAAVQFDRIVVEYGNHTTRAYPFRMRVRANGTSPVLDLAGGERDLTSVEFWYEKASWGTKPEVRLYGRR